MGHMDAKLVKYLRVYRTLFKYSFIQATAYRAGFLLQMGVELGYQVVFIVFFLVVLGNVHEIGGWSRYQVLFLSGLNIVASELILGSIFIFGLWQLPSAIKDGDIDVALLKPMNTLFNLTLSKPYFAGILATLPGICLMCYAAAHLPYTLSPLAVGLGVLLFLSGLVAAYSVSVIIASFCFYFVNASALPKAASTIINSYISNPASIYQGALRAVLFLVIPVAFVTSVPAEAMIRTVSLSAAVGSPIIAFVFLRIAIFTWNRMIKHYSSASS